MKVAIVIPAFNEAATIGRVVESVCSFGAVIVVDDHSTDGTGAIAERSGACVVRHQFNMGYDATLESGFRAAASRGAEIVVTFDADGQHDPSMLPDLLHALDRDGVGMVLGTRSSQARFAERLFVLYARLVYGIPDVLCGLKAFRMDLYRDRGRYDGLRAIGTELALASASRGVRWQQCNVVIHPRLDQPRLGSTLRANWRILGALVRVMWAELRGWPKS